MIALPNDVRCFIWWIGWYLCFPSSKSNVSEGFAAELAALPSNSDAKRNTACYEKGMMSDFG